MHDQDLRWRQRQVNYEKALSQLKKFIDKGELNELEKQGLIQAFEYTYELAFNVIKDFYENQGDSTIQGSRDAFRLAFNRGLIRDGDAWMRMIESRKQTSHTYNEDTAEEVVKAILMRYYPMFNALRDSLRHIEKCRTLAFLTR